MNRSKKEQEKNPVWEYEKIRKKYVPKLYDWFGEIADPRNESYITYGIREMLGTAYYKNLLGLVSMRSMNENFEDAEIPPKLYHYLGVKEKEHLPHSQTINDFLSRLNPEALENVRHKVVYSLIRRKSFDTAKYQKQWSVYVDATGLYSGKRKLNEHCLEKWHQKGTAEESVSYQSAVLEAKIDFGGSQVMSIGSEFIENAGVDEQEQKKQGAEQLKQDCEIKAFRRLTQKLKKEYPRLPMRIQGDSLYAAGPILDICKEKGWAYLLRYKNDRIPSIAQEFECIPEKEVVEYADEQKGITGRIEFVNDISYQQHMVHVLRCVETQKKGKKEKVTHFQYLSSNRITKHNAKKILELGRCRWKIENQGFKRQKREAQCITHVCCWNAQAMKNHYLLQQLADFFRKLYEIHYLSEQGIKKTQRKVSFDLLQSLYLPLPDFENSS